jgi:hypothetical protein
VRGETNGGTAVSALAEDGYGMVASAPHDVGMMASVDDGVALWGWSFGGAALVGFGFDGWSLVCAGGRVSLMGVTGVATIRAGRRSVTVRPDVPVSPRSFVLLTPQADLAGRSLWYTLQPADGTFTVRLGSARDAGTPIGWLILETGELAPMAGRTRVGGPRFGQLLERTRAERARVRRAPTRGRAG